MLSTKCNSFIEMGLEGKVNLCLPLYSLLHILSKLSVKQATQNKFKANLKFV